MASPPIYLDHNASSPLLPAARDAMVWALDHLHGNPSSPHAHGRTARAAIDAARAQVAQLCGASPAQVVFTSGGTEANNLALTDLTRRALRAGRRHVLASPLEHPSVLAPLTQLEALGAILLERLPVGPHGLLDPTQAAARLRPGQTGLVCCMAAHNSLGARFPIAALAAAAHAAGALLHCDATQAAGRVPLDDLRAADTLTLSAHKLGGPQGVGALITRAPITTPLLLGGGQEGGARSGTESLPGVVGFGAAAAEAALHHPAWAAHTASLRDLLWLRIQSLCPQAQRNSPPSPRCLPNTLHVSFPLTDGLLLTKHLDRLGVCVSAGSACLGPSGDHDLSLRAAHLTPDAIAGAVRFSLGPSTTRAQVEAAAALLPEALSAARA